MLIEHRQVALCEFKASLVCIVSSRTNRITKRDEREREGGQKKKKKEKGKKEKDRKEG